jgi:hypothetical protein
MPNYVFNILLVEGSVDDRALISPDEFDFGNLVRCSNNLIDEDMKEWRMNNWGTFSDAIDVVVKDLSCITEVRFLTIITRPDKWFKNVCLKFPKIKMKLISRIENTKIIITEYYKENYIERVIKDTDTDYIYTNATYFQHFHSRLI